MTRREPWIVVQLRETLDDLEKVDYRPDAPMTQRPAYLIGRAQGAIENAIAELVRAAPAEVGQ